MDFRRQRTKTATQFRLGKFSKCRFIGAICLHQPDQLANGVLPLKVLCAIRRCGQIEPPLFDSDLDIGQILGGYPNRRIQGARTVRLGGVHFRRAGQRDAHRVEPIRGANQQCCQGSSKSIGRHIQRFDAIQYDFRLVPALHPRKAYLRAILG